LAGAGEGVPAAAGAGGVFEAEGTAGAVVGATAFAGVLGVAPGAGATAFSATGFFSPSGGGGGGVLVSSAIVPFGLLSYPFLRWLPRAKTASRIAKAADRLGNHHF